MLIIKMVFFKRLCLSALLLISSSAISAEIALIIDDMGNTHKDGAAFELPIEVAFSILPMTHLSEKYSRRASSQQREVMLHMPMESLAGKALGAGALTANMSGELMRQTLTEALQSVPGAIGLNNHMGSKLTQLSQPMNVTMSFLTEHHLFFVDSRTTRFSKAERIARENGVQSLKRNVFLDHDRRIEQIDAQFKRLVRLSKKYGFAVGIAHPYPQTVEYLKQALKNLEQQGVQLSRVSQLLELQHIALQKTDNHPEQSDTTTALE
ncbi:divergent polysaccharide deacetylase family protein [Aliiglaciecola sp. LCG003]|uniref:divergent polysaccharide deacetylase family protein n=1 Tax=Aliiglaciecola sp. LCG003 TaxID=3053655 RepID=UPI002573F4F4|nr:divergent polysaccharide deacetylase family protein [Aliiglaciecola sp. LCG003]WJG10037.1 divergent polysaccharide deacetylase family protein [Aliiglaciecola sp. LCG003]